MTKPKAPLFLSTALSLLVLAGCAAPAAVAPSVIPSKAEVKSEKLAGEGQKVKNVIVMIADGWGTHQILAADFYKEGKEASSPYANFPTKQYMSTYSFGKETKEDDNVSKYDPAKMWGDFEWAKKNPTDSASAGTAMASGFKTYDAAIGQDQDRKDLRNIVEDFEKAGRSTGVISTVEWSHATPASFVAHIGSRNAYSSIANEMVRNSAVDVIMGAGNPAYDDSGKKREKVEEGHYKYVGGEGTWKFLKEGSIGADADGDGQPDNWKMIETKEDFEKLQTGETPKRVIGTFQAHTTSQQAREGDAKADAYKVPFNQNVPSLAVMSKGALNVLDNNQKGFFLMIEGGAVDWAGHANQSGRSIEEMQDFNDSVQAVIEWVEKNSNWGETLLIVTGDHETGYLTGTAGQFTAPANNGKGVMPTMTWNSPDHTNQLIPFYAKGQGAEILKKLADEKDPKLGEYIDNTELVVAIRELVK